jgi:hypothetical protein
MHSTPNTTESGIVRTVSWEPCPEFAADPAEPGLCATCGWLEDDHEIEVPTAA